MSTGPGARPRASVIIPTYNRCALLGDTLRHLARQTVPAGEFEVIVADDGSSDATRAVVDSFAGKLRTRYFFQEDEGFRAAAARNAGARLASGETLVFLDSGGLPGPDFVRHHIAAHRDGRRAVLGYVHGFNPDNPIQGLREVLDRLEPEQVLAEYGDAPAFRDIRHGELVKCGFDLTRRAVPWMLFFTSNCSVRAADFWAAGGFSEGFHGWGAEDLEFAFRLFKGGLEFQVRRDAWSIESPHERDMESNLTQFRANMGRFLRDHPEPVVEIGWVLVRQARMFEWEDRYQDLLAWRAEARDVDVTAELDDAARHLSGDERVAVVGAGAQVPAGLSAATLLDFDGELLGRARHNGTAHHAVGLRTTLADQSVDTVVVTSRLSGLWDQWRDEMLAEAHRIGRRVRAYREGGMLAA